MRPYKPRMVFDMEWAAPPATAAPLDMIFCKVVGQNIPACKMGDSCKYYPCVKEGGEQ